jgi:hypothetical protein
VKWQIKLNVSFSRLRTRSRRSWIRPTPDSTHPKRRPNPPTARSSGSRIRPGVCPTAHLVHGEAGRGRGKSVVERLIAQRDQLLQRWAKEPAAIDGITRSYERQIEVARKAAQAEAELERKQAEAEAARARTAPGQSAMGWVQYPFGNLRAKTTKAITALGSVGGAIAGVTAGLGAMAIAGCEAAKSLAASQEFKAELSKAAPR